MCEAFNNTKAQKSACSFSISELKARMTLRKYAKLLRHWTSGTCVSPMRSEYIYRKKYLTIVGDSLGS